MAIFYNGPLYTRCRKKYSNVFSPHMKPTRIGWYCAGSHAPLVDSYHRGTMTPSRIWNFWYWDGFNWLTHPGGGTQTKGLYWFGLRENLK
jgi:hypothetical protein